MRSAGTALSRVSARGYLPSIHGSPGLSSELASPSGSLASPHSIACPQSHIASPQVCVPSASPHRHGPIRHRVPSGLCPLSPHSPVPIRHGVPSPAIRSHIFPSVNPRHPHSCELPHILVSTLGSPLNQLSRPLTAMSPHCPHSHVSHELLCSLLFPRRVAGIGVSLSLSCWGVTAVNKMWISAGILGVKRIMGENPHLVGDVFACARVSIPEGSDFAQKPGDYRTWLLQKDGGTGCRS